MIELERTYLAKYLPEGLEGCDCKEVIDVYIPHTEKHPVLRIRKNGDKYEMTKKTPLDDGDVSEMLEETIVLSQEEFDALMKLEGKRVHKIRYYYNYHGHRAEVDVFQGDLVGLVTVDFEFDDVDTKNAFAQPDFCLADITQEEFTAGGMICGKSYSDIEGKLNSFNYQKIEL